MARPLAEDLDYLTARLHGRRSRLAEAGRLDALCRSRSLDELGAGLFPGREVRTTGEMQRLLLSGLAGEMSALAEQLSAARSSFLAWLLVRFQAENLKVLVRGFLAHAVPAEVSRHLVALPPGLELDPDALFAAGTLEAFAMLLPDDPLRESLVRAMKSGHEERRPFLFEAALDRGYFHELLDRMRRLPAGERDAIAPLVSQEIDTFHLMLLARGRFVHDVQQELLRPLHVRGSAIPTGLFTTMLADTDLQTIALRALGRAIDSPPGSADAASLESLAWHRYLRLAHRTFRRSHMGFGAVVAYLGIRRIEIANLITLSEGVRLGMAGDAVRARLVPRRLSEAGHV